LTGSARGPNMPALRRHTLENVRADGWLEKLGEGSPSFTQLCDVMGERFVAFSIVAGLRITSLAFDPQNASQSMVEIDLGDGGKKAKIPMGDLQGKLASAMIEGPTPPGPALTDDAILSLEELQAAIGYRWVLLAPIFHLQLEALVIDGPRTGVAFRYDGDLRELPIELFREHIRGEVRGELERLDQKNRSGGRVNSPFAIDLALVPKALAHADAGEHEQVVTTIGNWPGPLSMLMRTPDGQALQAPARAQIARALGALGSAHVRLGKLDWGQEVLRLGIQWAQDGEAAPDLFLRLGLAYLDAEREGEAIGLLRRALELGASEAQIAAPLARALSARKRHLAALVWTARARKHGVSAVEINGAEQTARRALGPALANWEKANGSVT